VREEGEDISPSNHPHQNKKKKKETTNKREKQQGFHKKIFIWRKKPFFLEMLQRKLHMFFLFT